MTTTCSSAVGESAPGLVPEVRGDWSECSRANAPNLEGGSREAENNQPESNDLRPFSCDQDGKTMQWENHNSCKDEDSLATMLDPEEHPLETTKSRSEPSDGRELHTSCLNPACPCITKGSPGHHSTFSPSLRSNDVAATDAVRPEDNAGDVEEKSNSECKTSAPAESNNQCQAGAHETLPAEAGSSIPIMAVHECCEAFVEQDGDLVFSHTAIILRKGDDFFSARTDRRYSSKLDINLNQLEVEPIKIDHVWPSFPREFTQAPRPLPLDCYVKGPSLFSYDKDSVSAPSDLLLEEAQIYEVLRQNPHPNIAQYLGCVVHGSRLSGLCFVKYKMTLAKLVEEVRDQRAHFDPDCCFKGIEAGVQHLHKLDLVHNDLNPSNIMFGSNNNTPVIIDFDSCRRTGQRLGSKYGTRGWSDDDMEFARRENDRQALIRIRQYLDENIGPASKDTIAQNDT